MCTVHWHSQSVSPCSPTRALAFWSMPVNLCTYRARIGCFGMLIAFNKKQVMSFFQSSFLIYVLYVLLHILHPFKMFGSFLCSFLVSLTVLAVFFILAFIGVFFLHAFFLNKCLVFRRKFIKLPLSPLQDLIFVFFVWEHCRENFTCVFWHYWAKSRPQKPS